MAFLCLLSPAKAMRIVDSNKLGIESTSILMQSSCEKIIDRCTTLKKSEIKSLMSLSDSLANLNYDRYQKFYDQEEHRAAYLFDGPAFRALNIDDFSKDQLVTLQSTLCILSGCYGILRPFDLIREYRLEMGSKLEVDTCNNLYEYWNQENITGEIARLAKENGCHTILNCASQEYSKVVDFERLREEFQYPVIDCVFKGVNNGRLPSVFGKQARGSMARFVAKEKIKSVDDLKNFTGEGVVNSVFKYSEKYSTDSQLVFERFESSAVKPQKNTKRKSQPSTIDNDTKSAPKKGRGSRSKK